jgi:hypothetical protein
MFAQKKIQHRKEKDYQHGPQNKAVKAKGHQSSEDREENNKGMQFDPILEENRPKNIVYGGNEEPGNN